MNNWPPILHMVIGALFTGLLAFTLNVLFRRTGKRAEWYDTVERRDLTQGYKLEDVQRRLDLLETQLKELHALVSRVEALEWKIGSWYRLVEENVSKMLTLPR